MDKEHILLVEDDLEAAGYLVKGLTESGHVVEHADQPAPHPVTTRSYAAPEAQAFAWYSASWVAASTEEAMAASSLAPRRA